jgi:hypothetical protein
MFAKKDPQKPSVTHVLVCAGCSVETFQNTSQIDVFIHTRTHTKDIGDFGTDEGISRQVIEPYPFFFVLSVMSDTFVPGSFHLFRRIPVR